MSEEPTYEVVTTRVEIPLTGGYWIDSPEDYGEPMKDRYVVVNEHFFKDRVAPTNRQARRKRK